MTVLLESQKNIGDSILYLFPNASMNNNFKVVYDGVSFKLTMWDITPNIPSLKELESVFEKAQEERNKSQKTEVEIIKKQQTDLLFELMEKGVL